MSNSNLDSGPATPPLEIDDESQNRQASEDGDTPQAPAANPSLDMENSETVAEPPRSDDDSDLSEVDEAEFADFDPTMVVGDDRPLVDIDEDVAKTLKASKKKRSQGEVKKSKEGKREKKKRLRREDEDENPDGLQIDGKRARKPKMTDGERKDRMKERRRPSLEPEKEENLDPAERRKRALDRAMDAALQNPNKRRRGKKDEEDLENAYDDEIAAFKIRMEEACNADNTAREQNEPAIHKLKMLPEVVALLNRNEIQSMILDPETNVLLSLKYYMEPLNDGSLPAYNIQRDLFAILARLPIEKEALLSSGIGKLVLYYTKSKKPEIGIKRTAERLVGEWSRPILKRSRDYKKRKIQTKEFNFQAAQLALRHAGSQSSQVSASQRTGLTVRDIQRERLLAPSKQSNRARMETTNTSYTVAPMSTFDPSRGLDPAARPIGASGLEAFKKMTANKIGPKKRG